MCAATPERVMPHKLRKFILTNQRILFDPRQNLLLAVSCGHLVSSPGFGISYSSITPSHKETMWKGVVPVTAIA